jgi:predicted dehydrogenase
MPRTIRWGIIGCGDVTEKKSGPGFQKATNSDLVAVMRRTSEKARDYAQRHNVPKWYDNADKLINDPDVNAIYIATPPETHKEYTLRASAVKKPVYVEKPMARDFQECEAMIKACQENQVPLFVAYYRRSLPKFLKVKELLDSGIIGKPRSVRIVLTQMPQADQYGTESPPWRVIPNMSGGGFFFDLASHTFDLLDFYFGPISSAYGNAENQMNLYPGEDIVSASFQFENNIIGSGLWCFTSNIKEDSIEIVGQIGKISFSTFSTVPVKIHLDDKSESITIDHPEHIQQPHIQSIVNELLGEGECPSHGNSAARTTRVMDQIIKNWRISNNIKFE